MSLVRPDRNSNQLTTGVGRTELFISKNANDDRERSYSVTIGSVTPTTPIVAPGAIVGIYAVFNWGGAKGGVTNFMVDASQGCRLQVDAADKFSVDLQIVTAGNPIPAGQQWSVQLTTSEDSISTPVNRFTDLGQELPAVALAVPRLLPNYARALTVITDVAQGFPAAPQVQVGFWCVAADYAADEHPAGIFVVDNNGQRLPIPPQAKYYTLEIAGGGPVAVWAISQFELTY